LKNLSLKKGIAIVTVASLAILLSYIALGALDSSKMGSQEDTALTIRVETDKPSYTLGETVKIKSYLINHKNETVKIEGNVTTSYDVFNSKGESIYGATICYPLDPDHPIVLPPQSETLFPFETFEWDQKFALTPLNFTDVSAGTYTIKVAVGGPFGSASSETTIDIKSALTIRVETDKPSYTLGETVKIKFYLINHKSETVKIEGSVTTWFDVFNSSVSNYTLDESLCGLTIFSSLDRDHPIVLPPQSETLFPFETFEWDQKFRPSPSSNITNVSPGTYIIKVGVESSFGSVSSEITIDIRR